MSTTEVIAVTDDLWIDYRNRLVRFVRSRIHDDSIAEDIVHDALANAWSKRASLRDENVLLPWLFQITMNAVRDHRRARHPDLSLTEEDVAEEPSPKGLQDLAVCMTQMIEQLEEPYRSAIKRSEIDGITMKNIAEELHISISGVKSRVQRGRGKLKDLVLACCQLEVNPRGEITNEGEHTCLNSDCGCDNKGIG
ncbi:MAG: sigma-70 family RNA polymerase sigma factor [Candidatus Kapabacteria bacterium]|nr:sigma-70 family RNA polymerase sigma factor [Candidatus Kapabacteria bacterium]